MNSVVARSVQGEIAFCPYVIALYVVPADPKRVHVVFRRTLPEVDQLLEGIVRNALGTK